MKGSKEDHIKVNGTKLVVPCLVVVAWRSGLAAMRAVRYALRGGSSMVSHMAHIGATKRMRYSKLS